MMTDDRQPRTQWCGETMTTAPVLGAGAREANATCPIGQSDVEMLVRLADGMGFGRTHDMLRRVIAALPYINSAALADTVTDTAQGQPEITKGVRP